MKHPITLCGLGNALVDIEINATDADLKKLGLEKGMMCLIDETRLIELLTYFPEHVRHAKACGGSAANTMIGATQFGTHCYYQCKVANDELGRFYIDDLIKNNVKTNASSTPLKNNAPTGVCVVIITPDAERTMNSFLGITSTFSTEDLNPDAIRDAEYLYIEGYLAGSETGTEAAIEAKKIAHESHTKTVLTFSDPSMVTYCKHNLEKILEPQGVDILFCNETEALRFSETSTLEAASKSLLSFSKLVVITEGKNGASIVTNSNIIKIPGFPANAIDTNGAGDLFAGVFMAKLTQGHPLENCGKEASFAASKLVEQYGPRLTQKTLATCKKA